MKYINTTGFEVLTAVTITTISWTVGPWSSVQIHRRYNRTYYLHLQGRISKARRQPAAAYFLEPEDGGSMSLRSVDELLPDYTASHPRR
jgi:hypothetical protein